MEYKKFTGKSIENCLETVANFRKTQFAAPPYSYAYDDEDEQTHLKEYSTRRNAICICAIKENETIGIVTGMPLLASAKIISNANANEKFSSIGYDAENFFYVGELIVLPRERARGIGTKLMHEIESYADTLKMHNTALLAIESNNTYSEFWDKFGYKKSTLYEKFAWPTFTEDGSVQKVEHKLIYWIKEHP